MAARTATGLSPRTELIVVAGFAAVLTLAVRLPTLGNLELNSDELLTADVIRMPLGDLIRNRIGQAHSPLYFLIVKMVGGDASEFMLRLPSALFDVLAAAILAGLLRKASGITGALAVAIFYAFTPQLIVHGQNARPYAMMNFFFAVAIAGTFVLLKAPQAAAEAWTRAPMARAERRALRYSTIAAAIGMVGVGWSMAAGWPALLILQGAVGIKAAARRQWRFVGQWAALSLLAWLAILPVIIGTAAAMARFSKAYWAGADGRTVGGHATATFRYMFGFKVPSDPQLFLPAAFNDFIGAGIIVLAIYSAWHHRGRPLTLLATAVALGLPAALAAVSLVQNVFIPRYALLSLIGLSILAADGAAMLVRSRAGQMASAILFAGVVLQGIDATIAERNGRWSAIGEYFRARGIEEIDGIIIGYSQAEFARRYLPQTISLTAERVVGDRKLLPAVARRLADRPTVWVIGQFRMALEKTEIAPGAVACRFDAKPLTLFLVARHPADIPAGLAGCEGKTEAIF